MSKPLVDEPQIDFPYSYFDEDENQFTILNQAQSLQLLTVLRNHFPAVLSIIPVAPFLVIECNKTVPDPVTTPFLIAGLIACFVVQGDPYPFGIDFIGEDGGALGFTEDQVPEFVWKDLKPFHIPRLATFEWIYKTIPLATHVSLFPQQLVVELEQIDDEQFGTVLKMLPDTIGGLNVGYINGLMLSKKPARKIPSSRDFDSDYDDTDYLHPDNGGTLKPGMLLECAGYVDEAGVRQGAILSNSGVKIQKNEETRVTVAMHGWDAVDNKLVYHPTRTGHNIGTIVEKVGQDIGILDCLCPYSNEFPDLQTRAQSLLHSSQLSYNQFVVIDSCFTGIQKMKVLGLRTERDSVTETGEAATGPAEESSYVKVCQGIYGVNALDIPKDPQIRDGVSGTPLIAGAKNLREMTRVIGEGMVAGFMGWNDIAGKHGTDRQIYCFCEPADSLIQAGWSVCPE